MKKTLAIVLAVLMLVSVCAFGASAEAGKKKESVFEAPYGTPTIDGTIDAVWNKAVPQKFDQTSKALNGGASYIRSSAFDAGQFRVLWDETAIYVLAEINDTTMMTKEQEAEKYSAWIHCDGVGLAIGGNWTNAAAQNNPIERTWALVQAHGHMANYGADNANVFITNSLTALAACTSPADPSNLQQNSSGLADADKFYRTAKTANGYLVEWKIQLNNSKYNTIKALKLEAGGEIPFDIWVDANDNPLNDNGTTRATRDAIYTWADPAATSANSNTTKGTLKLLAKPAPVVNGWKLLNEKGTLTANGTSEVKLTSRGYYSNPNNCGAFISTVNTFNLKDGIEVSVKDLKAYTGTSAANDDAWIAISFLSKDGIFKAGDSGWDNKGAIVLCQSVQQRFATFTAQWKEAGYTSYNTVFSNSSALVGQDDVDFKFSVKYDEAADKYAFYVNDGVEAKVLDSDKLNECLKACADGKVYVSIGLSTKKDVEASATISVKSLASNTPPTGDNTVIFALFAVVAVLGSAYVVVRKVRG